MKRLAGLFTATAFLAACGGGAGGADGFSQLSAPTPSPVAQSSLQLFPLSTAVASPAPGVLGVQDLSMSFTVSGAVQYVLAAEPGFQGTFTAKPTAACSVAAGVPPGITQPVTVSAVNGHAGGPQAVFAITAVAAGACPIKFNDGTTTNSAEILTIVTQSVGTVY